MGATQDGAEKVKKSAITSCQYIAGNGCTVTNLNGSSCKQKQKKGGCKKL